MTQRICKRCGKEFETPENVLAVLGRSIDLTRTQCPPCHALIVKEMVEKERQEQENKHRESVEARVSIWRSECGIPYRFTESTFENFEAKRQPAAYKLAHDYAVNYTFGDTHALKSLYLYSVKPELGVGKTHLSAAIGNHLINRCDGESSPCPFFYTTEREFLLRIRASFNHQNTYTEHHETEDEIYSQLIKTPLLILDDMGRREVGQRDGGASSFVQDAYWQIIDGRYQDSLPLVLTSNFAPSDLTAYLGQPSAERLLEMTWKNVVRLRGKSYRLPENGATDARRFGL